MNQLWSYISASIILGAMLLVAVLGLGLAAVMPGIKKWDKRFFMCFFSTLALSVCAVIVEPLCAVDPSFTPLVRVAACVSSLLTSSVVVMLTFYLLHCCEESWRESTLFRVVLSLWLVFIAMLMAAQFTDFFYYYTDDGEFFLGPWYPLPVSLVVTMLFLNVTAVIRRRGKLSQKLFYAFLIFLIPLAISMIVHMVTPAYALVYFGTTVTSLAMFILVVSEQIAQYIRLQQETTRQRAKIAVLQMRPHFIHNTMTSIYYLCDQDPKRAQQVTMDFNTYLRKNFNAIAQDETIPFSEELEHTRAYLAVEQAQFESKLVIDYDVPHLQFRMPPLTLQPLAENAVKHGMGPNTVPLRVTIRSRKVGSASVVTVEDNGPGFDPAIADNPHTTLANIRQRLEIMCNGKLAITHRDGGGSMVIVTIPNSWAAGAG